MCVVKYVKSEVVFPVIRELLEQGMAVRITVTGSSMYPFLRENIDSVELSKPNYNQLKKGDIVLIQRTNGQYILHRVIKKEKDYFFMVGDAQQWIEGPLYQEQLVAVATAIWRGENKIIS